MNNNQNFVHKTAAVLAKEESVESFNISFKTITINGEDQLVPDLKVVKKGAKDGCESNS